MIMVFQQKSVSLIYQVSMEFPSTFNDGEGDAPHKMLTYKYWPITPFMDFSFISFVYYQAR